VSDTPHTMELDPSPHPPTTLAEIARLFLRIGALGFGGPTAHVAMMQDELVERRGLVPRDVFLDSLGVTNLIPGPNSSEMAMQTGYFLAGRAGALVAGLSFLAPALVVMTALSAVYFSVGGFELRPDLFAGLQAVVIAVIAVTLWRLRDGARGWLPAAIAAAVTGLTIWLPEWEPVWLLVSGALTLGWWRAGSGSGTRIRAALILGPVRAARRAGSSVLVAAAGTAALPALAWVFLKTGALLFGGGYVLIPLLQPEVLARGWLTKSQFLDGIALGQATPGPITTTSAFVGYAVAGVGGALIATAAVYVPAFVAVMAGTGPFLRAFRDRASVRAFVQGVNAAALGAIAGAGVTLGRDALRTPLRAAIAVAGLAALTRRLPVWLVLVAGGAVSLLFGAIG
jgi:chromate transporter